MDLTDQLMLDTAPFMLTKTIHRDVYPAIDPVQNPGVSAEGKVAIEDVWIGFCEKSRRWLIQVRAIFICPRRDGVNIAQTSHSAAAYSRKLSRPGTSGEKALLLGGTVGGSLESIVLGEASD